MGVSCCLLQHSAHFTPGVLQLDDDYHDELVMNYDALDLVTFSTIRSSIPPELSTPHTSA